MICAGLRVVGYPILLTIGGICILCAISIPLLSFGVHYMNSPIVNYTCTDIYGVVGAKTTSRLCSRHCTSVFCTSHYCIYKQYCVCTCHGFATTFESPSTPIQLYEKYKYDDTSNKCDSEESCTQCDSLVKSNYNSTYHKIYQTPLNISSHSCLYQHDRILVDPNESWSFYGVQLIIPGAIFGSLAVIVFIILICEIFVLIIFAFDSKCEEKSGPI
jgi:hypothetical protein